MFVSCTWDGFAWLLYGCKWYAFASVGFPSSPGKPTPGPAGTSKRVTSVPPSSIFIKNPNSRIPVGILSPAARATRPVDGPFAPRLRPLIIDANKSSNNAGFLRLLAKEIVFLSLFPSDLRHRHRCRSFSFRCALSSSSFGFSPVCIYICDESSAKITIVLSRELREFTAAVVTVAAAWLLLAVALLKRLCVSSSAASSSAFSSSFSSSSFIHFFLRPYVRIGARRLHGYRRRCLYRRKLCASTSAYCRIYFYNSFFFVIEHIVHKY